MTSTNIDITHSGILKGFSDDSHSSYIYDISELSVGINFRENHIINLSKQHEVEWIISTICDHASGSLQPCDGNKFAVCPLHGWKLDLQSLQYCNVNVTKQKIDFELNNDQIIIDQKETHLQIPNHLLDKQHKSDMNVRFLAHACLLFECGEVNIITDPWLDGPCFLNGWWHKPAPTDDAMEKLLSADIIYISHNHPDHMHENTLAALFNAKPNIPIIIPAFKSKSAELPLKKIGFTNIHALSFNRIYQLKPYDIFVSILKSGDFRDDSGLYISYGKKQALITVDSSSLNHYVLPSKIDFLATSFAAGASGHPWCFDHYSEDDKRKITLSRHKSVKNSILKYNSVCKPRAYMPYAGYFSEASPYDHYIKENNKKNSQEDIKKLIQNNLSTTLYINPLTTDQIRIGDTIEKNSSNVARSHMIDSTEIKNYIDQEFLPNDETLLVELKKYFQNSKFQDQLILYISPCSSDFNQSCDALIINFHGKISVTRVPVDECNESYQSKQTTLKKLFIKARIAPLWQVISQHKSWEELSIGFHCRIHRTPDVYNSDFWYHFSNVYIK